jgi:hypothetical protein
VGNQTPRYYYPQNTPTPSARTTTTVINRQTTYSNPDESTPHFHPIGNVVVDRHEPFSLLAHLGRNDRVRTAEHTAISPSGTHAAIASKKDIRLFRISSRPSLIASGSFGIKKNAYHYGRAQLELQHHLPPTDWMKISSFTHIALSDEYLALAATEKVLIFNVAGEQTGRWLFCDRIQHGTVKGLAFSPDGSKLVALYSFDKKREEPYEAARFYSTRDFRNEGGHVKSLQDVHWQEVTWQISPIYEPRRIVFSWNGDMVAISTSYSLEGKACVRMLGESTTGVWSYWGERFIKVNNAEHRHEMVGGGVTGLSLYPLPFKFS